MLTGNLKKQFKSANQKNAKTVIIVGPKELKKNKVVIRDMKTGKETLKRLNSFK